MRPTVDIHIYYAPTKTWVSFNQQYRSIIENVIINLSDFDIDTFSIMLYFPQDFGLYEEFLNSPYWMEGNLITISVGYNEYPKQRSIIMSGVITGTRVRESLDEVIYTILGSDLSIMLKGKVTNAEILKQLSSDYIKNIETRDNAAVLLVKDILRKNKEVMKELNAKMKEAYEEMPDFGLDFNDDTIPNVTEEEKEYRRFVHVQNMSDAEKLVAKEDGREWGLVNKPAQKEFIDNIKEGSGYEIYTTYIETIASLGVILGRVFWYDSKEQLCYFQRPQDIKNRQEFVFYKTNQTNLNPFERILDFQADYSSLDSVWTIQSNFVSISKDGDSVTINPIITQLEPTILEEESENKEMIYTDTHNPTITGSTDTESNLSWWEYAVKASPDSYELQNSKNKTFYLKEFTVSAEIAIQGNPQIRPHDLIWLFGVGSKFEGGWFVKTVQHTINADKYVTNVELVRNLVALPKTVSGDFIKYKKEEINTNNFTNIVNKKNPSPAIPDSSESGKKVPFNSLPKEFKTTLLSPIFNIKGK